MRFEGSTSKGLVDGVEQEHADLDFKQAYYGTSDQVRRKLAGDIGALADQFGVTTNRVHQIVRRLEMGRVRRER